MQNPESASEDVSLVEFCFTNPTGLGYNLGLSKDLDDNDETDATGLNSFKDLKVDNGSFREDMELVLCLKGVEVEEGEFTNILASSIPGLSRLLPRCGLFSLLILRECM